MNCIQIYLNLLIKHKINESLLLLFFFNNNNSAILQKFVSSTVFVNDWAEFSKKKVLFKTKLNVSFYITKIIEIFEWMLCFQLNVISALSMFISLCWNNEKNEKKDNFLCD